MSLARTSSQSSEQSGVMCYRLRPAKDADYSENTESDNTDVNAKIVTIIGFNIKTKRS